MSVRCLFLEGGLLSVIRYFLTVYQMIYSCRLVDIEKGVFLLVSWQEVRSYEIKTH